jgi:hypothetical protein
MADQRGFLASFDFLDSTVDAIHDLRKAGFEEITAYSPFPEHHIESALGYDQSPVRVFTLVGALTGTAARFGVYVSSSADRLDEVRRILEGHEPAELLEDTEGTHGA